MKLKKLVGVVLCAVLLAVAGFAQDSPSSTSPQFTLNFNVLNGPLGTVGTDIAATYAVTANALLRSDNMLFPAVNGSYFGAGLQYALPVCNLLKGTNLNCEKVQFYSTGSLGESRITVGSNPTINHVGGMLGGGANYDPTGTGKFTVNLFDVHEAWLPGMANGPVTIASVGINLGWGQNGQAMAAKKAKRLKKEQKMLRKAQEAAAKT